MSLRIAGNNIIVTRGDTLHIKIVLEYSNDGESYELEDGDSAEFAIMDYDCSEVLVRKDVNTSDLFLKLTPSDTHSLSENKVYRHGVKITKNNGDEFTVVFGTLKLLPEVVP